MVVKKIKAIAKKRGINPRGMKKAELVRAIQVNEGNIPCYQTAKDSCDQFDCCWRDDCMQ